MESLIEELQKEHRVIKEALKEVKRRGVSTKEGQGMLLSTKKLLLSHLRKEDEHIYPVLDNAAKNDDDLKQTLQFYAANMKVISKAVAEFFDKYSEGGSGIEFGRDFGALYATLSLRIAKEEAALYRKIERLNL